MVIKLINRQLNAGIYHVPTFNIHTNNLALSKIISVYIARGALYVVCGALWCELWVVGTEGVGRLGDSV